MTKETLLDMIQVIDAGPEHVEQIVALGCRFFDESDFHNNLNVDADEFRRTIKDHMGLPSVAAKIAVHNGVVVGYVLIYCQKDYTKELIGELYQFYVCPEYRGTPTARLLVQAAINQYDDWGCVRAYAEASPGFSDPRHLKLFENLWKKHGYVLTGATFMRGR